MGIFFLKDIKIDYCLCAIWGHQEFTTIIEKKKTRLYRKRETAEVSGLWHNYTEHGQ